MTPPTFASNLENEIFINKCMQEEMTDFDRIIVHILVYVIFWKTYYHKY